MHDRAQPTAGADDILEPGSAGIVAIDGHRLRFRSEPRRPWSALHTRFAFLAQETGRFIRFDDGRRAPEALLDTPWGELRCLLWDLGGALELLAGREASGRPSPSPFRPLFPYDDLRVPSRVRRRSVEAPLQVQAHDLGQQVLGRIINFPVRRSGDR